MHSGNYVVTDKMSIYFLRMPNEKGFGDLATKVGGQDQ
jgi:hypothetical protein